MTTRNNNVKKTPATVEAEAVKVITPAIVEEVTQPAIVEIINQENVNVSRETPGQEVIDLRKPASIYDFSTITEKEVSITRDGLGMEHITICGRELKIKQHIQDELLVLGITRKFSTNMAKETDTLAKHKAAAELIELLEAGYWTLRDKKAAEKPLIVTTTAGKGKSNAAPAIGRFELIGMMRDLAETEKEITQTNLFNLFDEAKFNAVVAARMADKNPNSLVYRAIKELQIQVAKAAEKARVIEAEKTAALLDELDTL